MNQKYVLSLKFFLLTEQIDSDELFLLKKKKIKYLRQLLNLAAMFLFLRMYVGILFNNLVCLQLQHNACMQGRVIKTSLLCLSHLGVSIGYLSCLLLVNLSLVKDIGRCNCYHLW